MATSCNTVKNEKGGKDLLLKVCKTITATFTTASSSVNVNTHDVSVGDIIRFITLGALNDVVLDAVYFVVSIVDANNFTISATPGGTPITFTPGQAALDIEVFETVGGLRSKGFSFSAESVDVSNHGSNQWKEMLDAAGMRSVALSGSGVYTSEANFRLVELNAYAGSLTCFALVETISGRVYVGCFKISGLEASGDFDGEASYSISADSSGEIKIYQAA